jgi:cytochrome c oxidase subunit IV
VAAPVSMRTYTAVFVALLTLTTITVMASFIHMGRFNDIVALTIAVTKALLVLVYFMHLRDSPGLSRLAVVAGVFWLLTMIVLTMSDVLTRATVSVAGP